MHLVRYTIAVCTLLTLIAGATGAAAQGLVPPVEGSRPGQTFTAPHSHAAPAAPPAAQPATAENPAPQRPAAPTAGTVSPLVILEFSDLQCPDSARYNMSLKKTILQRYVAAGRVDYQWYDFPLPSHTQAVSAAAAARCGGPAADQIRYQIMSNQGNLSAAVFAQYATQAGISKAAFDDCMRSGATRQQVLQDKALGDSYGVRGTTTLVLGVREPKGTIRPVQLVKAYDPPQQVLSAIDAFIAENTPRGH